MSDPTGVEDGCCIAGCGIAVGCCGCDAGFWGSGFAVTLYSIVGTLYCIGIARRDERSASGDVPRGTTLTSGRAWGLVTRRRSSRRRDRWCEFDRVGLGIARVRTG